MTSDSDWPLDMEGDEAWFRGVCPEVSEEELEGVKLRARIAVQEAWLGSRLVNAVPADLAARMKVRVRAAIAEVRTKRPVRFGRVLRWAGGLAAAAAVGLFFWPGSRFAPPLDLATDMIAVFDEYQEDSWSESLEELDEEIAALEYVWGEETGDYSADDEYDDLQNAIDRLMWDAPTDSDWS